MGYTGGDGSVTLNGYTRGDGSVTFNYKAAGTR